MNDKKKVLPICLLSLVLAQFISFVITFSGMQPNSFVGTASTLVVPGLLAGAALGAFADTVLALSIAVLLYRLRSKSPFRTTSSMIDRIMMYTVGSGLLTAAFALAAFITLLTMPDNIIYIVLLEMLPECESVCCSVIIH